MYKLTVDDKLKFFYDKLMFRLDVLKAHLAECPDSEGKDRHTSGMRISYNKTGLEAEIEMVEREIQRLSDRFSTTVK